MDRSFAYLLRQKTALAQSCKAIEVMKILDKAAERHINSKAKSEVL